MTQQNEDAQLVAMAQAMRKFADQWPHQLQLIALKAKTCKARYDALRREGFPVDQSLQLCLKDCEL